MSSFTKAQLKFTRSTVNVMRSSVDKVNQAIFYVTGPFAQWFNKISRDAPWMIAVGATGVFMCCPLLVYPWVKPYLLSDERVSREAERVRLCLQKGIDPFPTIQHKDFVYGNLVPALQTKTEHAPKESSWEHRALLRYREEKEKLLKDMGTAGYDVDRSVVELLKLREDLTAAMKAEKDSYALEPAGLTFGKRENKMTI